MESRKNSSGRKIYRKNIFVEYLCQYKSCRLQGQYWDATEAVDRGNLRHWQGLWVEQDSDRGEGSEETQQRLRDILPGRMTRSDQIKGRELTTPCLGDQRWWWWDGVGQGLCLRLQEGLRGGRVRDGRAECGVQGGSGPGEDCQGSQRTRLSDGHTDLGAKPLPLPLADGLRLQGRLQSLLTINLYYISLGMDASKYSRRSDASGSISTHWKHPQTCWKTQKRGKILVLMSLCRKWTRRH